jgi:tagaturonate reductase
MKNRRSLPDIADSINRVLERLMPVFTPLGVVLGVFFPAAFLQLKPHIPIIFCIITLSGSLKLKAGDLGQTLRRPFPLLAFFLSGRVAAPLLALLVSSLVFPGDTDTVSGYVLLYAAPTAVTGFIWCSIFSGDTALTLTIILLDTILAPLVVPGTIRALLGAKISLDMHSMAFSLVYMIVIPTVLGIASNEISRGLAPRLLLPYFSPLSKLCVILVVSANAAAVAPQIDLRNSRVWIVSAVCVILTVMGFLTGKLAGLLGRFDRGKQVSIFFGAGLHNTTAAMTLGISFFPPGASLPSVIGIMFQQTICAVMGRLFYSKQKAEK